ncbi:MAG TPA: bifunctional precorrin-2 dehydrogenase/sirohydrochlorin ferrochelatase [Solirubrobacteraceae bacterium]|nr:bifunctional precorrin-2 dehydrogenase/sirohydrochlorin ferrochelatase [Solirubrobacteraceae bacterium]
MAPRDAQRCLCELRRGACDGSCGRLSAADATYVAGLRVRGRRCVVVGAGRVALGKVRGLLDCGARVAVVSPAAVEELRALAARGAVDWRPRAYAAADVDGAFLVIAATDDVALNVGVAEDAARAGALVNVVNAPALSDFIVPAVVRGGPVTLAVTTAGSSPALARRIRRELGERYGEPLDRLSALLAEGWARLAARADPRDARPDPRAFLSHVLDAEPDPVALLGRGDVGSVRRLLADAEDAALSRRTS